MHARRLSLAAASIVVLCGVVACGDSKGERPKADAPSSPYVLAAATSWSDPKDLLAALRAALGAGDATRVVAMYDASDPAAALKRRFWAAIAEAYALETRVRDAYTKKFGKAAWDADTNPVTYGTGADFGLAFSLSRLGEAGVDEEDGTARVGVDKFVFRVVRRDGRCVAFREETFGGNENEVRVAADGAARTRKVLAAIETSADAAAFAKRYEAIRAE